MTKMKILTEVELRRIVPLDLEAIACVEDAFHALATKAVAMPPILRLDIPEHRGEVDVKTAYVPGLDGFAIKISPGFFDNPKLGLPSLNGMMVLLSSKTGLVEALLLDNGYLTDVRTAAAGAVAAKHLSRPDSATAAIFGAGMQAAMQLEALMLVRPIRKTRIWARDLAKSEATAHAMASRLGIEVTAEANAERAVAGADIIVTTTPSNTPLLKAEWLSPGQHLTAMGSDGPGKQELDPAVLSRADRIVCDSRRQSTHLGELQNARLGDGATVVELGQVTAGLEAGRSDDRQITVCDLTGLGVQDTAIAVFAFQKARARGLGTKAAL